MSLSKSILTAGALLTLASASWADPVRVYSIQGADCGDCGTRAVSEVKKIKGVRKASFDRLTVELSVEASSQVSDEQVLSAIARAEKGLHGEVGAGHAAYLPQEAYPQGADVAILTDRGEAVGPLEKLRVPGKYTVFDVYADWCGPCRTIDAKLREAVARRSDIAVRKLNVVRFDSPLAKEFGPSLTALPHIVVFSPSGRRSEFTGSAWPPIARALGEKP